jgi:hypothetical protein
MAEESILKLHADLAWVLALVWIAKAGRSGEPQPQVHYYLGDRYWRLSERYKRRGSVRRAQRLRAEPSGISVQAGGTLCRLLPLWLCQFRNGQPLPRLSIGVFMHTHQTMLLKQWKAALSR